MRPLMIQGTSSWAGKSLMTTALARLISRRGVAVAPFKAQNMSNNARVVDGGEILVRCEVNPRYTMGWAVGMGARRPDRR